jgi:hypothetical protein
MADSKQIEKWIRQLAQRRRNVRLTEIEWVVNHSG